MAFTVNVGRADTRALRKAAPVSMGRFLATLAIIFGAFCLYDYSSYGDGLVAAGLQSAQHSFQAFVNSFRLRM